MSDDDTSLFCFFLVETCRDTDLQSWLRLPFFLQILRCETESAGHGFESCDEDAVVETLDYDQ